MAKPAFDPSQPFEKVASGKPAFDPSQPFDTGPSALEAGARGAAQGLSLGFADEIAGGAQALWDKLAPEEKRSLAELYAKRRDESRKAFDAAQAAHPTAYGAGEAGGALAGGAALAAATGGTSLAGELALGAGLGAAQGVGDAKELDGDALKQAAFGAATGGALAGVGRGVGRLLEEGHGALNRVADEGLAAAKARSEEMAAKVVDKSIRTTKGELGAETQKGNRLLENLQRLYPTMTDEELQRMGALVDDGTVDRLQRKLAGSNLEDLPGQEHVIRGKEAELADLKANKEANIAQRAADIRSPQEAFNQVAERAKRYLPPVAGDALGHIAGAPGRALAGAAIGAAVGGGDAYDAGLGALAGAGLRPGIHALRRMVQHPAVGSMAYGLLQRAVSQNPASLGRWARTLTQAASRGTEDLAVTHFALAQSDPQYQEHMQRLAQSDNGKE
jgi:hypothetical protein